MNNLIKLSRKIVSLINANAPVVNTTEHKDFFSDAERVISKCARFNGTNRSPKTDAKSVLMFLQIQYQMSENDAECYLKAFAKS